MPYAIEIDHSSNTTAIHDSSCHTLNGPSFGRYVYGGGVIRGMKTLENAEQAATKMGVGDVVRCPQCSPYALEIDEANNQTIIHRRKCGLLKSDVFYRHRDRMVAFRTLEEAECYARGIAAYHISRCSICSRKNQLIERLVIWGVAVALIAGMIISMIVGEFVWAIIGFCALVLIIDRLILKRWRDFNRFRFQRETERLKK